MLARLKRLSLKAWMVSQARLGPRVASGPRRQDVHRIALWQFGGVGDMLLATPVIRALADTYPDAQIDLWCSNPEFADFLRRFPAVAQIHRFPVYGFDARTLLRRPVRAALRAVRDDMLDARADLVVNLHVPAMLDWWAVEWWLIRRLHVPCSIGFDPRFIRHGSVYTASLNASARDGVHYTTLYRRLLEAAGIPCGDTHPSFPLSDDDRQKAAGLLAGFGAAGMRYVCLHVGGKRLRLEDKMWPVECFADLATRLLENGMVPVLIGVEDDLPLGQRVCGMVSGCVNLIGRTQIADMAALIAAADGFIGHDSGPFHVAAAVGTPCVAICGRPDAEEEYLKYDRDDVAVITRDDPLRIGVDEVYACAMDVFAHRGRGSEGAFCAS